MADGRIFPDERDRYRLLIDNISDYAIYMLDPAGHVASWNIGAQRFKGYRREEILGEHFSRFYPPEEREAGVPALALEEAARTGRFEREGWRLRKDGSRFWAHVIIDAIVAEGELVGFAKITRDLTERRARDEALRKSEEQLRLLIQGVTDYAIYMLDRSGAVTSWNAGAERIKGYAADEIIGQHFSRFYTEEDRAQGLPQVALDTAAREGRFEKEGWRLRRDGSRFFAHVIIDPIRDAETGEILGFAKVTRDITERLEAQRQIEIAREALFQSQKMEAIGQLTGGVAHDFNNLLMAVIGSLDLVKKRLPHDDRISPLIENALQGARRGAALTQRMLAFARRQELKLEAVDVPALVRGMRDFLARTLGPSIDIRFSLASDLPRVMTDPVQLESALLNLAVNARDAMPGGGVLTISAALDDVEPRSRDIPGGRYVKLSVGDSGHGMPPEVLARAAEPFFTTKGVGKGTGLGLSMVHGLAAQSGGKLDIASTVGEGTCIRIWLPLAAPGVSDRLAFTPLPERSDQTHVVLTVDDDPLVLLNNQAMLEELGHRVFTAESAAQALELLDAHPEIDLVLTDQLMPGLSGLELAGRIAERRPGLRVILATGFADLAPGQPIEIERLAKPYDLAALSQALAFGDRP